MGLGFPCSANQPGYWVSGAPHIRHGAGFPDPPAKIVGPGAEKERSEEHTSELQSHSFIAYAVFCLKKQKK